MSNSGISFQINRAAHSHQNFCCTLMRWRKREKAISNSNILNFSKLTPYVRLWKKGINMQKSDLLLMSYSRVTFQINRADYNHQCSCCTLLRQRKRVLSNPHIDFSRLATYVRFTKRVINMEKSAFRILNAYFTGLCKQHATSFHYSK